MKAKTNLVKTKQRLISVWEIEALISKTVSMKREGANKHLKFYYRFKSANAHLWLQVRS